MTTPTRPRILIVDHEVLMVRGLARHLASRARCDGAYSTTDALEAVKRAHADGDPFALVICAYLAGDGPYLARDVAALAYGNDTPGVLLMTVSWSEERDIIAENFGAAGLVDKSAPLITRIVDRCISAGALS